MRCKYWIRFAKSIKGRVGADLDYTYTKLLSDTILDRTNFYDYDFKAFNLFLRNFNIWYKEKGVGIQKHCLQNLSIIFRLN